MKFKIIVPEGCITPKGYGIAYWLSSYPYKRACFPVPVNVLVKFFYELYYLIQRGLIPDYFESKMHKSFKRGIDKGKLLGYNNGFSNGCKYVYKEAYKQAFLDSHNRYKILKKKVRR